MNTGNQVEISVYDVLDALHDYAWIHFTEEEALFMNNEYPLVFPLCFLDYTKYPQYPVHKKQHTVNLVDIWDIGFFEPARRAP